MVKVPARHASVAGVLCDLQDNILKTAIDSLKETYKIQHTLDRRIDPDALAEASTVAHVIVYLESIIDEKGSFAKSPTAKKLSEVLKAEIGSRR